MRKFRVGDKVEVLNRVDGHRFKIGEIVEIETDCDQESLKCKGKNKSYWLSFENIKLVGVKEEEKKVNKFKVGDIVRIIGNKSSGHGFNIGEIGTIDMICGKGLKDEHCRVASKNKSYYVAYKDMKLATETNLQTFTITVSDSSTTLTSDNETVEIKRYHEDKHDVKIVVNEVVKKYFDEVARANRPTKGKDLIGVEITKGTKFKVINVEPHRDKGYVCLDEYVGKVGSFAKDSFKFTENGYMCSSTFEEDYMNAIDKENGELFWRYDEVEILWEGVDEIN